ncbi:MAG: RNA polymerase sigma factor, partial [bacterium]
MDPAGVNGLEDAELVRRSLSGDPRACRDLVRRYQRPVYSVIARMVRRAEDAEDLTQET